MDDQRPSTERHAQTGYTAVVCDTCEQEGRPPLLDELGKAIRCCPHGVLVRAPCQLGALWCHARKTSRRTTGPMLLVQPCDTQRRPLGAVLTIGPIQTAEDLRAVTLWLQSSPTSPRGLPARVHQTLSHQGPSGPHSSARQPPPHVPEPSTAPGRTQVPRLA